MTWARTRWVMAKFLRTGEAARGPARDVHEGHLRESDDQGLAEAFGIAEAEAEIKVDLDAIPTLIQPRDPILARSAAPGAGQHAPVPHVRGAALLFFLGYAWAVALVGARAYEWISPPMATGRSNLRSVVFRGAGFIVLVPFRSWPSGVLIGRWKPQQIRIWSLGYFRFWIVKTLVRSNPLALLTVGSPLYTWYLAGAGAPRSGGER